MALLNYRVSPTFAKFHKDDNFLRIVMGPVGCVHGDTPIVTKDGIVPISSINKPTHVLSWCEKRNQFVFALTGGAFPKGKDYLYRVTTPQGEFVSSGHHQMLCGDGKYQQVDTLSPNQSVFLHSLTPQEKSQGLYQPEFPTDDVNYSQKDADYLRDYAMLAHQYGQQLLLDEDSGQSSSPLQDDAPQSCQSFLREDDLKGLEHLHNHLSQSSDQTCIDGSSSRALPPHLSEEGFSFASLYEHNGQKPQQAPQSQQNSDNHHSTQLSFLYSRSLPCSLIKRNIISIERLPVKEVYWDMQVLNTNNYVSADGAIHHNSGKSVGCCWEIYMKALAMPPNHDGIRNSRWIVVRNTLPQLETTTMSTWKDWFGPQVFEGAEVTGRSPYKQIIEHPMGDGTTLKLEMIFMALDGPLDIGKLMSLECTGIWFNELRYIDEAVYREAQTRPGQFPRKNDIPKDKWMDDKNPYWSGIIADTNPPDVGGWIYKLAEEIMPSNLSMYKQPSGVSSNAENLKNLKSDYYQNMAIGKPKEWVNVYVHGKYGYFHDGASVYEGVYNDDVHYTDKDINILPGRMLVGGIDASGRSPAAVILQQTPSGQYQCIWELCGEDVSAVSFSRLLRQEVSTLFPKHNIRWWGDPAGAYKTQTDERTYFDILKGEGLHVYPSPSFRPSERIEAVNSILSRNVSGLPALIITKDAPKLRQGFNGGYRYKKIGTGDSARTMPDPDKNMYSHVHDALQYAIAGTGELNVLKNRKTADYKTYSYETDW